METSLPSIRLFIRNPKKVLFDDLVKSITSVNDRGNFDILPQHGNFISLIQKYIIIHKINGDMQTINLANGVLYVKRNDVRCYIDLISGAQGQGAKR